RDGVDDPAAEAGDVAAQLDGQQVGPRVEADDELASLAFDLRREPIAKGERRHAHLRQRRAPERQRAAAAALRYSLQWGSVLERRLELAPGAELRHGRGRDLDALT